ncbi:MAG: hypothetical protein DSM106950_19585 [Stigonema ocellatum SAG 48.90 = DSM 106950]|nr:hypothetical protein [Stigonema ocellatum SAG 48.90 = DSM 106950]
MTQPFFSTPPGLAIAFISAIPFARPHFDELLAGLDFVLKNNYPTRGTKL